MTRFPILFRGLLMALVAFSVADGALLAQEVVAPGEDSAGQLDALFADLQKPDSDWEKTESRILEIWSHSGSPAMDLLLQRGVEAMDSGDYPKAIEHLSALIDHAPGFAEAWNARATAYFLIGEYGLSIADVQKTLALNPRHFGAFSGLGIMLEEMGDTKNALAAFKASQALQPHHQDINDAVKRLEKVVDGVEL
jgi:tetratricopeptide (TPR) repeat protein